MLFFIFFTEPVVVILPCDFPVSGDDMKNAEHFLNIVKAYGPDIYLARVHQGQHLIESEVIGRMEMSWRGSHREFGRIGSIDLGGPFNENTDGLRRFFHAAMFDDAAAAASMRQNVIAINDFIWACSLPIALSLASLGESYCENVDPLNPFSLAPESRLFERIRVFNPVFVLTGVKYQVCNDLVFDLEQERCVEHVSD